MPLRLLVIDDDPAIRRSLFEMLTEEGFVVDVAETAESAMKLLPDLGPDVVLTDVRMPGMNGIDLLKQIQVDRCATDVIVMTAYDDLPTIAEAMSAGALDFLVKPLRLAQLREVLARVIDDRSVRSRAPARETVSHLTDSLVGRHASMIEIYKRIGRVAASRANALILGETGTGKERVARSSHPYPSRRFNRR